MTGDRVPGTLFNRNGRPRVELPSRPKSDRFVPVGGHRRLRQSLRARMAGKSLTAVLFYCFDHRTRLLPFVFADTRMVPGGVRQVGASLLDAGFSDIRIVLQQWSRNVRPSQVRLDGRAPDVILLSAMGLHTAPLLSLIEDIGRIPEPHRPLILGGGPKGIYQPDEFFHVGGEASASVDAVCTGEDYILIELLDRLVDRLGTGKTLRGAFLDAAADGSLLDVPGLVFKRRHPADGRACLVNTGTQRLVTDLDDLPRTVPAYQRLEPAHKGSSLALRPLSMSQVARRAPFASFLLTQGCKFACGYCPIPAYNQRSFRRKSGAAVAEELYELGALGIRVFFGSDDNFFNDRAGAEDILETVAKFRHDRHGDPAVRYRWGTESTLFDADRNRDLFRAARRSGMQGLWFGIEDLTADLVKKGQSADKTASVFADLRRHGIMPMPMMMHAPNQPLLSRGNLSGLLNQVQFLRNAGAGTVQVTNLIPAVGTKWFETHYDDGEVFDSVGGERVAERFHDGNHVIAGHAGSAWKNQLNVLAAYAMFYNPINLIRGFFRPDPWHLVGMDLALQVIGMAALGKTVMESLRWAFKLAEGEVVAAKGPPAPKLPMVSADAFRVPVSRSA